VNDHTKNSARMIAYLFAPCVHLTHTLDCFDVLTWMICGLNASSSQSVSHASNGIQGVLDLYASAFHELFNVLLVCCPRASDVCPSCSTVSHSVRHPLLEKRVQRFGLLICLKSFAKCESNNCQCIECLSSRRVVKNEGYYK